MTTISPFSLSLPYRTENRRFSTLSCTKTGSTQPKLSAACFVVQSCLADADFVVSSNYCLIGTRQTGCLSFLGNESGEARNELQLRAPRRGVEAGSNSPGDCCVRERRAEPRNRRGIEEYVKEKIYIDGCTHFLPCDVRECRQQNLWAIKKTPSVRMVFLFGNVPQRRCICAMRRLSNRRWCGKLIKVGRDAP